MYVYVPLLILTSIVAISCIVLLQLVNCSGLEVVDLALVGSEVVGFEAVC